ncbi:MAG: hypothetical protein R2695_12790 [Acidimicrobiales bacterium]
MSWDDLYARARRISRAAFHIRVLATAMFAWTVYLVVEAIRELDALAHERSGSPNGIAAFSGYTRPDLFDYAAAINSSTFTYAIVTAILFLTAYLLKALGLIAEVGVINLVDSPSDAGDGESETAEIEGDLS